MPDGMSPRDSLFGLSQRLPPSNIQAEQALLGALLANNKAYDMVSEFLRPVHFADAVNGKIFQTISTIIDGGGLADAVTLKTKFEGAGILDEVGGTPYLAQLMTAMVGVLNAREYGKAIHDTWLRRQLIGIGEEAVNLAFHASNEIDASDMLDQVAESISEISISGTRKSKPMTVKEAVASAIKEGEAAARGETVAAVSTGIPSVDSAILGLRAGHLIVCGGRPGMGKAQPLDAKVLLSDGTWKLMGEIKLGDSLASVDGARSLVSGIFDRGEREVFRITFSDGRSAEACADHLWKVRYRDWDAARILTTSKLRDMLSAVRYKNRLSVDRPLGYFGSSAELPIDPYLLGALLGDGELCLGRPRFSTADPEMVDEIRGRLEHYGIELNKAYGTYAYSIVTRFSLNRPLEIRCGPTGRKYLAIAYPLKKALLSFGLWGRRSEEKFIPDCYMSASREQRLDILRGLMDTDGWVQQNGSVGFSSSSLLLSEGVRDLVRSLGGQCRIRAKRTSFRYKGELRQGRTSYLCMIRAEDAETYFLLQRKSLRAVRGHNAKVSLNIISIEPARVADTRCISVTHSDNQYITDEYVVTHNTAIARSVAINVATGFGLSPSGKLIDNPERAKPVAYFALEETSVDFGAAAIAQIAGVPMHIVLTGDWTVQQAADIVRAQQKFETAPLEIFDRPRQSIRDIARDARAFRRRYKSISLLVVDYLQLMPDPAGIKDHRLAVGQNAYGLKDLAKELQCPILLLSQLGRQVEDRPDHRPTMRDLRETGEIEDAADVVMFPFREAVYFAQTRPKMNPGDSWSDYQARLQDWSTKMTEIETKAELIVPKVRRGAAPVHRDLYFNPQKTRFEEVPQ